MATRRYKLSAGKTEFSIVEEAGAAVNSDHVELTIELANTAVNAASGTRSITKEEVLNILEAMSRHIIKNGIPA